jgi:hypothetical protein
MLGILFSIGQWHQWHPIRIMPLLLMQQLVIRANIHYMCAALDCQLLAAAASAATAFISPTITLVVGVKAKREKLFGFGHRVYKNFDPRAKIIRGVAEDVFKIAGRDPLIEVAIALQVRLWFRLRLWFSLRVCEPAWWKGF